MKLPLKYELGNYWEIYNLFYRQYKLLKIDRCESQIKNMLLIITLITSIYIYSSWWDHQKNGVYVYKLVLTNFKRLANA